MTIFDDGRAFAMLYAEKTGRKPVLDPAFVRATACEEEIGEEMLEAKDLTEQVDALIDSIYFLCDAIGKCTKSHEGMELWRDYMLYHGIESQFNVFKDISTYNSRRNRGEISQKRIYTVLKAQNFQNKENLIHCVFLVANELSRTHLNIQPLWDLVHAANMTKFEKGHMDPVTKKWIKPADFVAPDDAIRIEIQRQLETPH